MTAKNRRVLSASVSFSPGILAVAGWESRADETVPDLPTIEVAAGPAFPLEGHLESTAMASGEMGFEQVFDAGEALFHTPFNGLDGVGISRLPDGTPIPCFTCSGC